MKQLHIPEGHPLWNDGKALLALILLSIPDYSEYHATKIHTVRYIAMDKDGEWYGYSHKPIQESESWWDESYVLLLDYDEGVTTNRPWEDTLTEVKP